MATPGVFPARRSRLSRLLFHWRGDRFELTTLTGQAATFSRAATASPVDDAGVARTVVQHQPAWEAVDWDGDAVRDRPALLLGASDRLYWNHLALPQALTIFVEFVEAGTRTTASAAIAYLGNAGNTGARLWVDSTGSFYRVRHHNGTSEVTSTIGSGQPTAGQRVRLRATLDASGRVQIFQSINGATETSGTLSGTLSLASAWSDTRCYLNSTGDTNNGVVKAVTVRLAPGALTASQIQRAW